VSVLSEFQTAGTESIGTRDRQSEF